MHTLVSISECINRDRNPASSSLYGEVSTDRHRERRQSVYLTSTRVHRPSDQLSVARFPSAVYSSTMNRSSRGLRSIKHLRRFDVCTQSGGTNGPGTKPNPEHSPRALSHTNPSPRQTHKTASRQIRTRRLELHGSFRHIYWNSTTFHESVAAH